MDDVVGQFVISVRDENLLAVEPVAAVPAGRACMRTAARSEPAWGSVKAHVAGPLTATRARQVKGAHGFIGSSLQRFSLPRESWGSMR